MQRAVILISALALATTLWNGTASGKVQYVTLALEERTTLRVGELARLQLPSERQYLISEAGNAVRSVRRSKNAVVYRAVRPGTETIVLSPAHLQPGECISCGTLHYFVSVVSRK
jgi:hypothetical protein